VEREPACGSGLVGADRAGPAAVARREHASAAELAAGLGLGALEALRIAARSGANRGALLQSDALPALVGLLKARPRGGAACCSLPVLLIAMPRPAACSLPVMLLEARPRGGATCCGLPADLADLMRLARLEHVIGRAWHLVKKKKKKKPPPPRHASRQAGSSRLATLAAVVDVGGDAAELGPQLWLAQRLLARAVAAADAWVAGEARGALGPPPAPDAAECAGGCPRLREPGAALSALLSWDPPPLEACQEVQPNLPHLPSGLIPLSCNKAPT